MPRHITAYVSMLLDIRTGAVALDFEAAEVITVLVLLSQVLEWRVRDKTSGAIRAMLQDRARPQGRRTSTRRYCSTRRWPAPLRAGEKLPVDSEMAKGRLSLEKLMVADDSLPVTKEVGAKVIART